MEIIEMKINFAAQLVGMDSYYWRAMRVSNQILRLITTTMELEYNEFVQVLYMP